MTTARRSIGKRGQAAHEFLTTYGWAAAVALVALLVMFYFGSVNPAALRPASCSFPSGSGIECVHASAQADGTLELLLLNRGAATLLVGTECRYAGGQQVMTRTATAGGKPLSEYAWGSDEFLPLSCRFDGDNPFAGNAGKQQAVAVTLTLRDATTAERSVSASVRVAVEAAP